MQARLPIPNTLTHSPTHPLTLPRALAQTHAFSAWPIVHARQSRVWVRTWPARTELWPQKGIHRPQSLCNTEGLEAYTRLDDCEANKTSGGGSEADACFAIKYDALRQWVRASDELLSLHGKMTALLRSAKERWTQSLDLDGVLHRVQLQDLTLSILGFEDQVAYGAPRRAHQHAQLLPDKTLSTPSDRVSDRATAAGSHSFRPGGRIVGGSGILASLSRVKQLSAHACIAGLPGVDTYAGALSPPPSLMHVHVSARTSLLVLVPACLSVKAHDWSTETARRAAPT